MSTGQSSIGGNPPIPDGLLQPAPWTAGGAWWLASGRDAYLLAARLLGGRRWLLPDLLCPVVLDTLRKAGATCAAYRPGALGKALHSDDVVVLAWDPQGGPHPADDQVCSGRTGVVEDRCLWAGFPAQSLTDQSGRWAIGSCRKWLGGIPGGWLAGPATSPDAPGWQMVKASSDEPISSANLPLVFRTHVLAVHSAAFERTLRHELTSPLMAVSLRDEYRSALENANLRNTEIGEETLGTPIHPRPQSRLSRILVDALDGAADERSQRAVVARRIQNLLGSQSNATLGVTGIRVHATERDASLKALREVAIYAPVHWRDGDWSNSPDAARIARDTFTLPCPVGAPDDYLQRLEPIIRYFDLRAAEPWS